MRLMKRGLLLAASVLLAASHAGGQELKLGTVAPQGSPWTDGLQQMAADVSRGSAGSVQLRIYAGGVAGDEADMLRKARVGQIEGLAITSRGLSHLYPSILALMLPMHFRSEEQFQYVFDRLRPRLEEEIQERGFRVLAWSLTGWVYLFSRDPVVTVDDLRPQRLWVWSVDSAEVAAWQAAGFEVANLPVNEIATALQTGLIHAVLQSPPYAAATQWFGIVNNMANLRFSPLFGAIILTNRAWQRLSPGDRQVLVQAAERNLQGLPRDLDQQAISVMQRYGLQVQELTPAAERGWIDAAQASTAPLIGPVIEPDLYEAVVRLLAESGGAR